VSNRLNKSNVSVNTTTGIITFKIVGITKSDAQGDASIEAKSGNNVLRTALVSVVIPAKIATPHDTAGGGVVIENRVTDATTSPAAFDIQPGQVILVTIYARFLTVTVQDQFSNPLDDIYVNAEVSELVGSSYRSINSPLSATGTFLDPFGFPIGNSVVVAGSSEANNWLTAAKIPAPSGCEADQQNVEVKVDGFSLNPAIVNRSVTLCGNGSSTTSPPVQLNVLWPN